MIPALALTVMFSGCNALSGKCTYELRSLEVAGAATESGSELAAGEMSLSEQRGSIQGQSLTWVVTSTTLKGHVLSASLKDNANPSQVLLDLPIASADRPEITRGTAASATGANLAGFHDILAAGRGLVELRTDLSSRPVIQIALAAATNGDWIRPYCS